MKRLNLSDRCDDELVKGFADAAKLMGGAVLNSETRQANRIFHYMQEIDSILRARGRQSRLMLEPLLDNEDRFVRYYAAQYLLGLIPDRARKVVEWNAKYGFDAIAGDAGMTLDDLDSGFYKPN